ncbi:uncharacterized protein M6B38_128365 [Iris pallida]|uniref:Reverse transcriptase domain-containing protein n=1 Tax=Iris pallida TaxID=29817 RepID=A0AAX6G6I6_IRIPA|nr:uncharacterized protein M6B38_128365 [Iris pallida]
MEKPFDRVDWAVMIWIFRAHGFVEEWIDILWRSVSNCHFSPMINGVASGFFKSHRGLKQDDPLSPTIFVVMADLFSRCLNRMGDRRSFSRYYLTSGCLLVTHLAYADDVLIFSAGDKKTISMVDKCINRCKRASGQRVNKMKSVIYVLHHFTEARRAELRLLVGMEILRCPPFVYLGCPMAYGRRRSNLFTPLIDKINCRIKGWHNNTMSPGGRLILLRHVLGAIPMYILAACNPPKNVLRVIEKLFVSFFWGHGYGRMIWASWQSMAKSVVEGGMGLRRIPEVIYAFSVKLWWRLRSQRSLWIDFFKGKHFARRHPTTVEANCKASHVWLRILRGRELGERHIKLCIGNGSSSILFENWTGEGRLAPVEDGCTLAHIHQVWMEMEGGTWS